MLLFERFKMSLYGLCDAMPFEIVHVLSDSLTASEMSIDMKFVGFSSLQTDLWRLSEVSSL